MKKGRERRKRKKMTERMEGYLRYIDSDHWRTLRGYKLAVNPRCQNCKSGTSLHVHHVDYRDYYSCTTDDLVVLCVMCHNDLHDALRLVKAKPIDYPLPLIGPLLVRYRSGELGRYKKLERIERRAKKRGGHDRAISRIVNGFWNSQRKMPDIIKMRDGLSKIIDIYQGTFRGDSVAEVILNHNADPF